MQQPNRIEKGTLRLKTGLAEMLKGGVIMDVTDAAQAKIAEEAGATAVMALERVPADIRVQGGVARRCNLGFGAATDENRLAAPFDGDLGARCNIADIDHDNAVGILDLELFCDDWLLQDSLLDTDLDLNGVVDIADFAEFAAQWLWTEP